VGKTIRESAKHKADFGSSPPAWGKIQQAHSLDAFHWSIPTSVRKLQQATPGLPPVFGQSPPVGKTWKPIHAGSLGQVNPHAGGERETVTNNYCGDMAHPHPCEENGQIAAS
jgi:hypothetical protein